MDVAPPSPGLSSAPRLGVLEEEWVPPSGLVRDKSRGRGAVGALKMRHSPPPGTLQPAGVLPLGWILHQSPGRPKESGGTHLFQSTKSMAFRVRPWGLIPSQGQLNESRLLDLDAIKTTQVRVVVTSDQPWTNCVDGGGHKSPGLWNYSDSAKRSDGMAERLASAFQSTWSLAA